MGRTGRGQSSLGVSAPEMTQGATVEPLPLYHRVYLLLRQRIVDGAWPPDAPMPGEHELALSHGVSRITVRHALARLEREGMVLRRRGAGTFARLPVLEKRRDNLRGLLENLLAMGLCTQVRLLEFAYVAAPADVAAHLDLPVGEIVQRSVRVRSARGISFSHLTAWVPETIGRRYAVEDLAAQPLLSLLEQAGVPAQAADQIISARLADSDVAPLLGVELGSPLLWVRRQVRDADGRAVEYIEALYRPEAYEYQIALVRQGTMWTPADTAQPSGERL